MGHSSNNSEKSSEIDRVFQQAEKLREKSCYLQSLRLFKKALKKYEKVHETIGILHCSLAIGDIYRMIGNFDLAIKNYTYSIELAKTMRNHVAVSDAKVGLALSLRAQGNWQDTIKLIREARKIYMNNNDKEGTAFTLWAEAGTLRIKGDIIKALKKFKESYAKFKSLDDPQGVGYSLCGLGGTSRIAGFYKESKNYYETANKLFSQQKDTFGKAYSFCGIGNAYRMLNDFRNALRNFKKAAKLYEKIGDKVSYSYTLWGMGMTYSLIGNNKKAHDYFINSMKLFQKTKDPRGIIYCRIGLGQLSLIDGRSALAKKYIETSLTESMNKRFRVEAYYAKILQSCINSNTLPSHALRKRAKWRFSGKREVRCYNTLGLKLRIQSLPLNIP